MIKFFIGTAYKGKHTEFSDIEYFKCKTVRISSKSPVLIHTDAEIIGTTPIKIKVVPKAIKIIH